MFRLRGLRIFPDFLLDTDYGIEANAFALRSTELLIGELGPQPNLGYFVTAGHESSGVELGLNEKQIETRRNIGVIRRGWSCRKRSERPSAI